MSPGSARLFVGLRVEIGLARALRARIDAALSAPQEGVRWSAAEDYHLTLCFLGQVEEAGRERLAGELALATRALRAPRLRLAGTGAFPAHGRARVLWAAVEECAGSIGALAELRQRVEQAARAAGLAFSPAERDGTWTPHITLARLDARGARQLGAWFSDLAPEGVFEARAIELCQSHATAGAGGGRYPVLRAYELLAAP